jgi:uncharacterized membrane protein YcjF (UPF0283 family)
MREESARKMPENPDIPQKPIKISWWKLAFGLILVLIQIENWLTPDRDFPDAFRASNETQQFTMYVVSVAIFLIGIGFIVAGFRAFWLKRS